MTILQVFAHKGKRQSRKVGAPTHAADNHIRVFPRQVHLLECLFADHCLVQHDMVQNRTQPVLLSPTRFCSHLHSLGDSNTKRTRVIRTLIEIASPGFCAWRRAGKDLRPKSLHDHTAIGLAQVGGVDHEHFQVDAKHLAGHRQGAAPLTGAGFSRHGVGPADLVEESLGNGRVELVRAGWGFPFILEVNMGGRVQRFFEPASPDQRSRTVELVDLAHFIRNGHVPLHGYFLLDQREWEKGFESVFSDQFLGGRVEDRRWFNGAIGVHVIPKTWNIALG